jgi:hypothetical protein
MSKSRVGLRISIVPGNRKQVVLAYGKLEAVWRSFLKMNVLSFTGEAQASFAELRPQCPRLRSLDLRIASIALITDATLLSRNLRDFRQVPGLRVVLRGYQEQSMKVWDWHKQRRLWRRLFGQRPDVAAAEGKGSLLFGHRSLLNRAGRSNLVRYPAPLERSSASSDRMPYENPLF